MRTIKLQETIWGYEIAKHDGIIRDAMEAKTAVHSFIMGILTGTVIGLILYHLILVARW